MIPFILAAVGGYLIGDSMKDSQTFADGGYVKYISKPERNDYSNETKILDDKLNSLQSKYKISRIDMQELAKMIDNVIFLAVLNK